MMLIDFERYETVMHLPHGCLLRHQMKVLLELHVLQLPHDQLDFVQSMKTVDYIEQR